MNNQPKIKISLNPFDRLLWATGWALLGFVVYWLLTDYLKLPERIGLYYQVDQNDYSFANKTELLRRLGKALFYFVPLSVLNYFPEHYQYPTKVTKENAEHLYKAVIRAMNILKLCIIFPVAMIYYQVFVLRGKRPENWWFWLWENGLTLGAIVTSLAIISFIYTAYKYHNL